ncbi:hypothetical protein Q3G72_022393 [Acer saccharum]|nr:hypothetical protein Q3G72_022393 [Acer saccharum]
MLSQVEVFIGQAVEDTNQVGLQEEERVVREARSNVGAVDMTDGGSSLREESSLHALWSCPFLKKIRSDLGLSVDGTALDQISFLDFCFLCKDQVKVEFELLCFVWWRIWFRRNQMLFSNVTIPVDGILDWAVNSLSDFGNARGRVEVAKVMPAREIGWKGPDTGVVKINTDGALSEEQRLSGVGVVIRD